MIKTAYINLVLAIIGIITIIYLVYFYHFDNQKTSPLLKISVGEAKSRRFGLIIDGRTEKEREELGYYPNSIPISTERVKQEVPLLIPNKNTWILIYCNTGNNSSNAAQVLYRMGYKNVRYINETYLSLMPGSS